MALAEPGAVCTGGDSHSGGVFGTTVKFSAEVCLATNDFTASYLTASCQINSTHSVPMQWYSMLMYNVGMALSNLALYFCNCFNPPK